MDDEGAVNISFTLATSDADEFLRAITEDDSYRDWLHEHPQSALAKFEIHVSGDAIPDVIELPEKGELNWLFASSEEVEASKPPMPTFGLCLIWGICLLVSARASERPPPTST